MMLLPYSVAPILFQFLGGAIKRFPFIAAIGGIVKFQFLGGAIKSNIGIDRQAIRSDFNSSVVRLRGAKTVS